MSKSSGTTRASSSRAPRGLGKVAPTSEYRVQPARESGWSTEDLEGLAGRLLMSRALTLDPDDAVYEEARNLSRSTIENTIENSTDYFATATRDYVQVGNNDLETGEAMREWGADDVVNIPYGNRSLMDIVAELRSSNVADIYRKYR